MNYQIKLAKKTRRGFSLVEVIVVIGIMGLLTFISTSVYSSFKTHENLEIAVMGVVGAIRHAGLNATVGKGDSKWGVEILPNSVIVFKGVSYENRDTTADQTLAFPGGVAASGLSEIAFEKLTGTTANTGTITLTNSYGIKNISINEKGILTY